MQRFMVRPRFGNLFVLSLLLSLVVVSCGPESSTSKSAELGSATVRWATWDRNSPAETMLVKQFQEAYPQVEFKREELTGNATNALKPAPPDLLNMDIRYEFNTLLDQGKFADLTDLWEETGLRDQIPASLQRLSERDGKQFYIPFGFGWVGFYYNKQIFAQYNLQPPENWEQFLLLCETLALNGETPLALAGADPWSSYEWFEYLDLRLNGAEFHRNLTQGKESFQDQRVRNVLESWKSLFDLGYFTQSSKTAQGLSALTSIMRAEKIEMLNRDRAVMALSDAYYASQLPAPFMQQVGFFRFPIIDPSMPVAEAVDAFGYVIPVGSDNPSHAIAFLRQVSTPQSALLVAQQGIFSSVTYAPSRKDVETSGTRADQQGAMAMIQAADETVPYFWLTLPDQTWGMMQYHFTRFTTTWDVDAFMSKLEEARQEGIKKGLFKEP